MLSPGQLEALIGFFIWAAIISIILGMGQIVYQIELWYEENKGNLLDDIDNKWNNIKEKLKSFIKRGEK